METFLFQFLPLSNLDLSFFLGMGLGMRDMLNCKKVIEIKKKKYSHSFILFAVIKLRGIPGKGEYPIKEEAFT